jgi:hypothetical protein
MKFRFIVMLLSITLSFSALSQDRNHIVTKVVLGGQSDTIEVNAFARSVLFHSNMLDPRSFTDGVIYFDENNNKKGIPARKIAYLELIDFDSLTRCFVNSRIVFGQVKVGSKPELEECTLMEEMMRGRINWYRSYSTNLYDGSIVPHDFFIKDGELSKLGLRSVKKLLLRLVDDNNELVDQIKTSKFSTWSKTKQDQLVYQYLEQYNKTH